MQVGRRTALAGLGLAGLVRPVEATDGMAGLELAVAARCPTTPTGITVSRGGRLFVFMPRFDGATRFTAGEVAVDGTVTPFPNAAANQPDPNRPQDTLFHVPNGVMDAADRLWLLDAGLMASAGPPVKGAPKLVCLDIGSGAVLRVIPLTPGVVPTSSLNDLRVRAGSGGREVAFITDQGQDGQGAILAVDLASGRVARWLGRHSSTRSVEGVVKIVEGRSLMQRGKGGAVRPVQGGANGLALTADGARVFYSPLMARRLYSADAAIMLDPDATDAAVAATVVDHGEKGLTGGLIADDRGRIYLALQELNAVGRWTGKDEVEILASGPDLVWPDTFWITPDRWLYVSATQVNRRPEYNGGEDRQKPPYGIYRMRIDAGPA